MTNFYRLSAEDQASAMEELAREALSRWEISSAELDLIKYRENAVFSVLLPGGTRYALRIHRHEYHSDDELRSELQWMEALNAAGILVPTVVPLPGGELFTVVKSPLVPEPRQVDLFEWITGKQIGSIEEGMSIGRDEIRDVYGIVGETAARLHNQAMAWETPGGFHRHAWDAEGLTGEEPLWGRFWELEALNGAQREQISAARELVHADLQAYGVDPANADRYGLIHADCVVENLMIDGDQVRLIDFDDAGYGWHLFELATAVYFETNEDHYQDAYDSMIEGYRRHRPLSDDQLARMPLFLAARSFTYLGWVHTRSETDTAKELTPMLIDLSLQVVNRYLDARQAWN